MSILKRHQRSSSALGMSRTTSELCKRLSGHVPVTDRIPDSLSASSCHTWILADLATRNFPKRKRPTTEFLKTKQHTTHHIKSLETHQLRNDVKNRGGSSGQRENFVESSNSSCYKQLSFILRPKSATQKETRDSNNNGFDESLCQKTDSKPLIDGANIEYETRVLTKSPTMTEFQNVIQVFRETRLAQKRQKSRRSLTKENEVAKTENTKNESVFERTAKILLAQARFKRAIRLVLILLKWVSAMLQKQHDDQEAEDFDPNASDEKKMTTFTDLASDAYNTPQEDMNNSSLSFDPAYFKAKREVNISNEVKYILSLPPFARTPEQLQTVLYGLQHLRSFAEYPLHMQEKLCKVAWFSQVPPKRVIIRQGHTAENFYFILSGQAVVNILEVNPKTKEPNMRTATVMRKGMSFGELALLHHSKRTATVVSQDFVQLLAIGRDDFFDIFMSGQGPGEIPEHVKFLKGTEFMKGWPIETLEERPEQCLFHFFKRGVVIVKDSLNSEWIYVVKSGTCQVMKELKQVTGTVGHKKKINLNGPEGNLPQLGTCEQGPRINNGRQRRRTNTYPIIPASALRSAIADFEQYILEMQEANVPNSLPIISDDQSLVGSTEHKKADANVGKERKVKFEDEKPIITSKKCDKKVQANSPGKLRVGSSESMTSSSDATSRSSSPGDNRSRAPIFVQVELLTSRDVFGLSNLFDIEDGLDIPKTSVSLISRGAECVMINKDFFLKHASDEMKRHLRTLINIYPEEETLQENLQIKADWDVYKKQLIKTMTQKDPR